MTVDEILAALQAILDSAEGRSLTDEEAARYEDLEKQLSNAQRSQQIRARNAAYNMPVPGQHLVYAAPAKADNTLDRAFEAYLRSGQPNQDISDLRVKNEQSETTTAGGYTVPTGFRQRLVEVMKAYGGLAAEVDSFNTGNGQAVEYPSLDDTASTGDITAENAVIASGTDLVFGTVTLGAYKYTSAGTGANLPLRVSVELLQDSAFDIAGLVARSMGTRIARKQAAHWCTGSGVGQPKGIVASTLTLDKALTVADTITYADLLDCESKLDPAYEANAVWVMNKAAWSAVRGVTDAVTGRPLILPTAQSGMGGNVPKELLGYRVVLDQGMPAYGDAGAFFAVLGDLREAYVIRRVSNLAIVVNPYSRASYGQVEYTGWERADGTIQNRSAYVILANHA